MLIHSTKYLNSTTLNPGTLKLPPVGKHGNETLSGLVICAKIQLSDEDAEKIQSKDWLLCEHVVSVTQDRCKPKSWVVFRGVDVSFDLYHRYI
jgi:hypothetical protein